MCVPVLTSWYHSIVALSYSFSLYFARTHRQLSETLGLHTLRGRPWQIQACSAKTGDGLREGLEWVMSNLKKKD
jgi:hypothetical protein